MSEPQMMDSIVCGVDVSDAAWSVFGTGRWLADRMSARLVVVHVVEEPIAQARELASVVENRLGAGDREVRLAHGEPADALLKAVEEDHAAFLVVGSRGRSSLASGVFGSVSRQVTADASVPVVVVPPGVPEPSADDPAGRSIVCGVDGSEHALATAQVAGRLARSLGCRLVLVHALMDLTATAGYLGARATNPPFSGQPDARERLAEQIVRDAVERVGDGPTGVVEVGAPWDVLEAVADRESGWLLVVAARGAGPLRSAMLGSVAARLATSARRPVMMVSNLAEGD